MFYVTMSESKKAESEEQSSKLDNILFILIGIGIFLTRYLPFYEYDVLGSERSLSQAYTACNSLLGSAMSSCNEILMVNWLVILLGGGLAVYGFVKLIK